MLFWYVLLSQLSSVVYAQPFISVGLFWRDSLVNKLFQSREAIRVIISRQMYSDGQAPGAHKSYLLRSSDGLACRLCFCSRLCSGSFSHHPANHRGASVSHPVQSRAASPGEGTGAQTSVTLRTPQAVPDELRLARVVGSWHSWPGPANRRR